MLYNEVLYMKFSIREINRTETYAGGRHNNILKLDTENLKIFSACGHLNQNI